MTVPGEVIVGDGDVVLFDDATSITVAVRNTGDRPIQVGSHYHVAEANPALSFDRAAARASIPVRVWRAGAFAPMCDHACASGSRQ